MNIHLEIPTWLSILCAVTGVAVYYVVTRLAVRHEQRASVKRMLRAVDEEDVASRAHIAKTSPAVEAPLTKRDRPVGDRWDEDKS